MDGIVEIASIEADTRPAEVFAADRWRLAHRTRKEAVWMLALGPPAFAAGMGLFVTFSDRAFQRPPPRDGATFGPQLAVTSGALLAAGGLVATLAALPILFVAGAQEGALLRNTRRSRIGGAIAGVLTPVAFGLLAGAPIVHYTTVIGAPGVTMLVVGGLLLPPIVLAEAIQLHVNRAAVERQDAMWTVIPGPGSIGIAGAF